MQLPDPSRLIAFPFLFALLAGCSEGNPGASGPSEAKVSGTQTGARTMARADLVIREGRLLDMVTDAPGARAIKALVIRDGKIERILAAGSVEEPPPATRTIDAGGLFIMPGLIDSHIHFRPWIPSAAIIRRGYLHYGVTSVQDFVPCGVDCRAADANEWLVAYKELVNRASFSDGPTLYISGKKLDLPDAGRKAHAYRLRGPEEIGPYIEYLAGVGVDLVNPEYELPLEYRRMAVTEAHRRGLPVAGHAPDIRDLIDSGQRFVEHMSPIAHALANAPGQARFGSPDHDYRMDLDRAPALIEEMVRERLYLNPTMISRYGDLSERAASFTREDEALFESGEVFSDTPMDLRPRILAGYRLPGDIGAGELANLREGLRKIQTFLRLFSEAGGMVIAATDTVATLMPGVSLHREMQMLVDAGLTPYRVLLGATRWPSEFLFKQELIGTLEEGKQADVLLLGSDPTEAIANSQDIRYVIRKGGVVRAPEDCSVIIPPVSRTCWGQGYSR